MVVQLYITNVSNMNIYFILVSYKYTHNTVIYYIYLYN